MNHAQERGREPVAEASDADLLKQTYLAEARDLSGALDLAIRDVQHLAHVADRLAGAVSCGFVRRGRAELLRGQ